jgi:hypothetical protein
MGVRNHLIEGVSGTGKTSVCDELRRRGFHSINGDRDLAYQGDPKSGEPLDGFAHEHHIWDVDKVRTLVADQSHTASFFCGGSRNFDRFIDLFDGVFVLEVDLDTLCLSVRPEGEWGGASKRTGTHCAITRDERRHSEGRNAPAYPEGLLGERLNVRPMRRGTRDNTERPRTQSPPIRRRSISLTRRTAANSSGDIAGAGEGRQLYDDLLLVT